MKIESTDDCSLHGCANDLDYPPIETEREEPRAHCVNPRMMGSNASSTMAMSPGRCSETPAPYLHPYDGPVAPLSRAAQTSIQHGSASPSQSLPVVSPLNGGPPTGGVDPSGIDLESQTEGKSRRFHLCSVCGKDFDRPSTLQTHLNIHTKEHWYACGLGECGKMFNTNSNAKRHQRTHGAPGPPVPPPSRYPRPVQFVQPMTYASGSSSAYPISSSTPFFR
ncbi:hypothetical protein DFH09DRAFT_1143407 [Mycena vulgaris]|nr:hypothetical protein DFH09DRAFT_1143407 [Mycena vulgaris]